jgi:hypothetical protein
MATNFLKREQPVTKRKAPENRIAPGFLSILKLGSALAELRCATCGFEAVLPHNLPKPLDFTDFLRFPNWLSPWD